MARNKLIIYPRGIFQLIVILSTTFVSISSYQTIHAEENQSFIDSPQGKFTTLKDAINNSYDGDTLNVFGGKYSGPISVDKTLTIIGHNWPVLDGGNLGTVMSLKAPNIVLKGFLIVNSGKVLDQENSGLAVESTGIIIEENRFENTLFGIYLRKASNSVIRNNIIQTKNLPPPRRGDPIRIWFSNDVLVENNKVEKGRDVVLWYSERLVVRGNNISGGRYGLHFMYCDDAIVETNRLINNSVGAFLMYSSNLHLKNNFISGNRGPSGYGIGVKDLDDAVIRDNLFVDNRIGIAVDNSPRQIDGFMIYEGNIFSFNDIGVRLTPSVHRNQFKSNSFINNQEQVSIAGGGQLQGNYWTVDGIGNYWSDYAGYDANQNGVGDIPYKSEKLFENLMDRYPELRLFLYSPAAQSVDFAARALPMIKPRPKLVDNAPLMDIKFPEHILIETESLLPSNIGIGSGGLLVISLALFSVPRLSIRHKFISQKTDDLDDFSLLKIEKLTKKYKTIKVVNEFNLKIAAGESVAMWGSNGAGKTTIIRCILGLLEYEGSIKVNGLDLKHHGKAIRRLVGYVPQELELHEDLSVVDTMIFYSHFKKSDQGTIPKLLKDMELLEHSEKLVKQLSGGMKQKLGLALALLSDPPILILDEPTANLDTYTRKSFLLQILKLKKNGKTLIFASHRTSDILNLADRVLVLENGRIIDECHPAQIKLQNTSKVTMYIYPLKNQLEKASSLLQNQGFEINCRDSGISVSILSEEAIKLLSILIKGGINITDFDLKKAE